MHAYVGITILLTRLSYLQAQLSPSGAEYSEVFPLLHLVWALQKWLEIDAKSSQEYGLEFGWLGLYSRHTNKQPGIQNEDYQSQQNYMMTISCLACPLY